jgi:hypothetical protein
MHQGYTRPRGNLTARKIVRTRAPLLWRLQNALRVSWLRGWIAAHLIAPLANAWGVATMIAQLDAVLIKADGTRTYYDALSHRVITTAGVNFLVADWDVNTASATNDITTLKYHGCGTGTTAEATGDTALVTESTTALNPDSTRPTGTQSHSTANILVSVGTATFDASAAITEHGLFSQAATGGGTLWDRSVFSAINVVSGDSIQFTYSCTVSAGG